MKWIQGFPDYELSQETRYTDIHEQKMTPWESGWQESYYGKFKLELDNPNLYASIEEPI